MEKFLKYAFAEDGDRTAIPDETQPSGDVSYEQGYSYDYSRDQSTDPLAKNIERDKMNSLLYVITRAIQELQSTGVPDYITAALNGGTAFTYAVNALVRYDAGSGVKVYRSLVDNNTALPTDTSKWADALSISDASETVAGKIRIATQAEVLAGTSDLLAVTPAKLLTRLQRLGLAVTSAASNPNTASDCNADLASGTYYCSGSVTNAPAEVSASPAGTLIVLREFVGARQDIYLNRSADGIWFRRWVAGVVSASGWIKLNPAASTALAGLIKTATDAEAAAMTVTDHALVPSNLAALFARSHAASGYQKLPGGLILQWGYVGPVTNDTSTPFTLPIAFTIAGYAAVVTSRTAGYYRVAVTDLTTTQITIRQTDGAGGPYFSYIAIGK